MHSSPGTPAGAEAIKALLTDQSKPLDVRKANLAGEYTVYAMAEVALSAADEVALLLLRTVGQVIEAGIGHARQAGRQVDDAALDHLAAAERDHHGLVLVADDLRRQQDVLQHVERLAPGDFASEDLETRR